MSADEQALVVQSALQTGIKSHHDTEVRKKFDRSAVCERQVGVSSDISSSDSEDDELIQPHGKATRFY